MKRYVVLAALGLLLLSPAFASAAIYYAGPPGTPGYGYENGGSVGSEFISNVTADVIKLGVFDNAGDGLVTSHLVSLWTASGVFITSATVAAGTVDELSNGYRWVTASASIVAGNHYVILAKYYGTGWNAGDMIGTNALIDPAFTFVQDRDTQATATYNGAIVSDAGPGLPEYTTFSDWGGNPAYPTAWFGPNLQVVPEPATIIIWSLLGALGFGLGWSRRRGTRLALGDGSRPLHGKRR